MAGQFVFGSRQNQYLLAYMPEAGTERRLVLQKVRQPKLHVLGKFSINIWSRIRVDDQFIGHIQKPKRRQDLYSLVRCESTA